MGDHDEDKSIPGCGDGEVDGSVAEPIPEEDLTCYLEVTVPPCGTFVRAGKEDEVGPGEAVEIEAAHG